MQPTQDVKIFNLNSINLYRAKSCHSRCRIYISQHHSILHNESPQFRQSLQFLQRLQMRTVLYD